MIHIFPHARATLKAHSYFVTTLEGYADSQGRFKVFDYDEAPEMDTSFIHVEQEPADENQNSGWADPYVMFHVTGGEYEKPTLWAIAQQIGTIFKDGDAFAAIAPNAAVPYQVVGDLVYSSGRNPVTEQCVVSVGIRFGIVE